MSEENKTEAPTQEVTQADLELAARVIIEWHKKRGLAFAIVNSGSGMMISGGNALELESALNHAHRMVEFDNGTRFMEMRQIQESAAQAKANNSVH
jgi:hypothetical protein